MPAAHDGDAVAQTERLGAAGSSFEPRVAIGDQELAGPGRGRHVPGDDMVLLGIRAEYIQASSPNGATPNGLEAEALVVEPLGSHLLVTAGIGDQRLKVVTRTDFSVQPGQRLHLQPEVDKIRWLRASDGTLLRT